MRVRFQNTLEDLQAEQDVLREHYRQTPEAPPSNRLGVFLILGVLVGLLCVSLPPGDVLLLIAPVAAAIVFLVGLPRLAGRLVDRQRYDELVAGYPTEIERYPDGLEWSACGGLRTFTPAGNLGEIIESRNRLFVLWKHSSPQQPHLDFCHGVRGLLAVKS